jgi:SPP1 family predicted phage head-tail adaptor
MTRSVDSGRLRHRVTWQDIAVERDSDEEAIAEFWEDVFDRAQPAEITHLQGRELIAAQALHSKVSVRIKARFRSEYKATMRGLHRGAIYSVESVIPDPDSGFRFLNIFCSIGVNEG